MEVIRKLSDRVEKEHEQHLRDNQRLEDRSAVPVNGGPLPTVNGIDFESLVGSSQGTSIKADAILDDVKGWEDDVWGSILNRGAGVSSNNYLFDKTDVDTRALHPLSLHLCMQHPLLRSNSNRSRLLQE